MIRLRGHTLLCLQGFRGEGYSPAFIDQLSSIHRSLAEDAEQVVELVESPDSVCQACPHLSATGCRIDGDGSEAAMIAQDRAVLARLGFTAGARVRWADVLDGISRSCSGADLETICGNCRWLGSGYCREGVDALSSGRRDLPPLLPSMETSKD